MTTDINRSMNGLPKARSDRFDVFSDQFLIFAGNTRVVEANFGGHVRYLSKMNKKKRQIQSETILIRWLVTSFPDGQRWDVK